MKTVVVATNVTSNLVTRWLKEMGHEVWSSEEPSALTAVIDDTVEKGGLFDLAVAEVGVDNWLEFARFMAEKAKRIVVISGLAGKEIEESLAAMHNVRLLIKPISGLSVFRATVEGP